MSQKQHERKMKKHQNFFLFIIVIILTNACSHMQLPILENTVNKYNLSTETELKNPAHLKKIETLYNGGTEGYFEGAENIEIYYKFFIHPEEKAAVVISSGRTEAAIKYKELIFDLYNNGFSVYIFDHRGQGLSGRMLPDPEMGYIDNFENYVKDMKKFYDTVVTLKPHKNIFLLAHSMGGAIAMTYLEEYPDDFTAAAFSSPMLGLPCPTCELIGILTGDEPKYAMGHSDYEGNKEPFEKNTLTNSEIRFEIMNNEFEKNKKARLGGATYQWVYKSCKQFEKIFKNLDKIKTPLILFSAENEEIVDRNAHSDFIEKMLELGKTVKSYEVPKAKHELFIETDEIRIPVLTKILDFFDSYVKK